MSFAHAQDLLFSRGHEQPLAEERRMTMGKLRDAMQVDMELKNFSSKTMKC